MGDFISLPQERNDVQKDKESLAHLVIENHSGSPHFAPLSTALKFHFCIKLNRGVNDIGQMQLLNMGIKMLGS